MWESRGRRKRTERRKNPRKNKAPPFAGLRKGGTHRLRRRRGWATRPRSGVFLTCPGEGNKKEYSSNHRRSDRWNHHVRGSEPCNRSRFEENNPTEGPRKQRQQRVVVAKDGDVAAEVQAGEYPENQ